MSSDLILNSGFTLPGEAATLPQIECALAYLAGFSYKEERDGRHIFIKHDLRHKQELPFIVMREDDPRMDSGALAEIVKSYQGWSAWLPLHNGRCCGELVKHGMSLTSEIKGDGGALVGVWKVAYEQQLGDFNRTLCNMKLPFVQVGEDYMGKNLFETVCRAVLGRAGRYKDIYLYWNERDNHFEHIALNGQQFMKLSHGSWETFHRRFVWFPSLNPYAYILEGFHFPPDVWAKKCELAAKELKDRAGWKTTADLRDFLENYRYRGKPVFDNNRLPRGDLNDY